MNVNLYKIEDWVGLQLELDIDYIKATSTKEIYGYTLTFYYKKDREKAIKWTNMFKAFDVDEEPTYQNYRGILMIQKEEDRYAIPFGYGSFLLQKFCYKEFGVSVGRKIKLNRLNRKASTHNRNVGRKGSATTYNNTTNLDLNSGEIITQLSFEPEEKEILGKRIDLGKSIRTNRVIPLNEKLIEFIEYVKVLEEKDEIVNKIPYLIKVNNEDEIGHLNQLMITELLADEDQDLGNTEMNIIGSSIYFDDYFNMTLKYGHFKETKIEHISIESVKAYAEIIGIDVNDAILNGKVIYFDDNNDPLYSDRIYNYLNFDITSEKAVLYEGNWYHYNDDFIGLIHEKLNNIEFLYDSGFDGLKKMVEESGIEGLYLEDKINKYLESQYGFTNIDRQLLIVPFENILSRNSYRIEMGDLVIGEDELCALKQGDYKSFTYCMDQSELAGEMLNRDMRPITDKYGFEKINIMSCWFLLKIPVPLTDTNKVDFLSVNSLMLKRKIVQWNEKITSMGYKPKIRINSL